MKYAKHEINGITIYNQLPHPYKNYPNFPNESAEIIEAEGFLPLVEPPLNVGEKYGKLKQIGNTFIYEVINIKAEEDAIIAKAAKDEFKNNLTGVFAYATTPDGTKEYAIKIGNDGKIVTVLIP